jgi:hypothetical protein
MIGEQTGTCNIPPSGWKCSRRMDHGGPCAAYRDHETLLESTRIKCESYTDYKLCFGLYKEQSEAVSKWMKEHDQEKHIPSGRSRRYSGAIGGAYTFEFTKTSIGTCVHVRCSCGEAIDVSDYDNW